MTDTIITALITTVLGAGGGISVLKLIEKWMDKKAPTQQSIDDYQRGRLDEREVWTAVLGEKDVSHKKELARRDKIIDQTDERIEAVIRAMEESEKRAAARLAEALQSNKAAKP